MSLLKIAWRSILQRGLASALTTVSMALGVMMVVAVLSIHGVVAESFRNNTSLGYNLIVGAEGGKLQLTLNTVYYLSSPVENLSYDYYLEFCGADFRREQLMQSIRRQVHAAEWQGIETSLLAQSASGGMGALSALFAEPLLEQAAGQQLEFDREGKYSQFTGLAIPLCLGDYFGRFRVVGTTPDFFNELRFGPANDRQYEFSEGRNFENYNEQHGYFEAVLGAAVAREMKVKLGDEISPTHGDPEGTGHAQKFTIVGILKSTATPNDRAAFINMEGFYLMDDHAKPLERDEEQGESSQPPSAMIANDTPPTDASAHQHSDHARPAPLPVEQRQVTSILLKTVNQVVAVGLPGIINKEGVAQCVLPIKEINNLFYLIVNPIQSALLILTAMICVVSGISILVSIYNSMSDRRHEIAVMRALGANRGTVMTVILLESVLLSLGGGVGGWLCGHGLNWLASGEIEQRTGVTMSFFSVAPPLDVDAWVLGSISPEWLLVPALVGLAIIVGFLPAMSAYRTDVAESLGS